MARRRAELASDEELIVPTCSSRTIVYKGMLSAPQLPHFYPDLVDERFETALALVHSRFSTNTFPSWELAHPYRMLAHNGEVNTLEGNRNWMRARHSQLESELLGGDISDLLPIIREGGSDSATLDNVVELLVMAGRSLPHALMMLIPEAFDGPRRPAPTRCKGFFRYHSCLMEPWDGPASVSLHRRAGHRRHPRPQRAAPRPVDGHHRRLGHPGLRDRHLPGRPGAGRRPRAGCGPGRLFIVDLERGKVFADGEIEAEVAARRPYGKWFEDHVVNLDDLPDVPARPRRLDPLRVRQLAFGWTAEDVRVLVSPLATKAKEADGSMGSDVPLAVLSDRSPSLFSYFKQRFAQVTNPAIDPIRESIVMSLQAARRAGAQPPGGVAEPRPPAGDAPARPPERRAAQAARRRPLRLRHRDARLHLARSPKGPAGWSGPSTGCAPRPRPPWGSASPSSSCRTGRRATSGCRCRRCWPSRPCTTTWCGGARGCGRASWSSRASPARCTTSPACWATAPARSTPTCCSSRCPAMIESGELPRG